MVEYVRSVKFEGKPKYAYVRRLVRGMMEENKFECDWKFDWLAAKGSEVHMDYLNEHRYYL